VIRITGTLHEDRDTFLIISRPILPIIINVSDRRCRENQNTHFMINNFSSKNRADCEIIWENFVESDRPRMAIGSMRIACWVTNATHTHTHTHRICDTYCFSTTTIVTLTHLSVTSYVCALSVLFLCACVCVCV
jgi:hypothetical protein